jgi:hypothetical protein
MFNLLPKDDKFYDELEQLSDSVVSAAKQFEAIVSSFPNSATSSRIGHCTNDAQKTMGIIVAPLAAAGQAQRGKPNQSGFQGLFGKHEIA